MWDKEFIVDIEFYQGGEATSWVQTSFGITEVETESDEESLCTLDYILEWVEENFPDKGEPRITNIWTV